LPLLDIQDLKTYFFTEDGVVQAVDGVSFDIEPGQKVGLVGESGCGKSVTALSIMRLVPDPPGRIVEGKVLFQGRNLLDLNKEEMRRIRGASISMIFQDPMTSLNPVFTVGSQIDEAIQLHQGLEPVEAREKTIEMLNLVRIPNPDGVVEEYPHELSGGMRQRCMIAMALSCRPKLLIADEPTTALDVTIEAQILDLMDDLNDRLNTALLLITHDMGVIAEMCEKVAVMYAGTIVEMADVRTLFNDPQHPYTIGLLSSIPSIDIGREDLKIIPGAVPDLINPPSGCRFHPRCAFAKGICKRERPELVQVGNGHYVACHR
jgi:peptide/nickel transport system ATP-binding protein/oligopeptide transport system ATP-binding protein